MAVKYGKFEMPQKILVNEDKKKPHFAQFVAEPFERGLAHTLGNSIRRMLLSTIEAPAIVSVRIEGVPHEYMAIDGILEDMTNIILNFKDALLRRLPQEDESSSEIRAFTSIVEVTQEDLDANNGNFVVTLADVIKASNFEVINPNLKIFTATKPMRRQIDLKVMIGRGYVPSERIEIGEKAVDEILVDAIFSPVKHVSYFVENTRVGQDTDFDRLVLEVKTDGRITPTEALSFSTQLILKHFDVFHHIKTQAIKLDEGEGHNASEEDELMEKLSLKIDEIELSVRSTNCLSGASIETIGELVLIPERKMLNFKNFGKKSLNEIKHKLHEMGLSLGMDLGDITIDNVREKIKEFSEAKKNKKENLFEEE